jgi:hypothetical protein
MPETNQNQPLMPRGEASDPSLRFTARQVADAFDVEPVRIERAMRGEFGLEANGAISSHQAQQLAEIVLAERPLGEREAALMRLGAYTPRSDVEWGLGDTYKGEESDRLASRADMPDDDLASRNSSYDPATQNVE